ncbi:Octanoyltransferase, mitochondrial [Candida viswanathii]|uniref:Octanoyltransferase n=1 Tax=Candida viswanathii TaxID=5486 RepID=A0A367Y557_9ASCO|nr:Octanoyltransferase, mitochondrial [Candida viswanathii]
MSKRLPPSLNLLRSYHTIRPGHTVLNHVHFPGITTFQHGLDMQRAITDVHLSYKSLETKVRRMKRRHELTDPSVVDRVHAAQPRATIFTFEFHNVYAGGLRLKNELSPQDIANFATLGSEYYQLERGGQVTWHGEGQLVAYLMLDLKAYDKLTTKCFVSNVLLKSAQNVLKEGYGLDTIQTENPGIWVTDDLKIGSVGIRVRHGITDFGISLNVDPELKFLNTFEMCGLKSKRATSVREQLGIVPKIEEVADLYVTQIGKALEVDEIVSVTANDL